jgi:hypothetical protein
MFSGLFFWFKLLSKSMAAYNRYKDQTKKGIAEKGWPVRHKCIGHKCISGILMGQRIISVRDPLGLPTYHDASASRGHFNSPF